MARSPAGEWQIDPQSGWLPEVRRVPSPNCDDRPEGCDIDTIVVHGISLPEGEFGTPHVEALFCNRLDEGAHPSFAEIASLRVSAHVLIRRDGDIVQFVPFTRRAWHAGRSEHRGRANCNDFSIGIELEGSDFVPYEERQYHRLAALARALMVTWPGIRPEAVVGHCHIAPGRKTDPGPHFDWDKLRALIRSTARPGA